VPQPNSLDGIPLEEPKATEELVDNETDFQVDDEEEEEEEDDS